MVERELYQQNTKDPFLKVVLKGHKKSITDISFHPSIPHQFATSSEDATLMLWNTVANSRTYNYIGHEDAVTGIEYSRDSKILASCSRDQNVRFWTPTVTGDCTEFKAHLAPIECLNFSDDSKRLLTGARDKAVKMWDVHTKQFLTSFVGHCHWIRSVKFFPDGKTFVSSSEDKMIKFWDSLTGQCVHTVTGQYVPVCVAPYPNNNSIAVGMSSGEVRIYELRAQKFQQKYYIHEATTHVSWHPYDNYLLSCGTEGAVKIVDVLEGRPIYTIKSHEKEVTCAKFSPDGEYFITGGNDNYVMVWQTNFIKYDANDS